MRIFVYGFIIGILLLTTTGISFAEEETVDSLRKSIHELLQNNEFEKALELTEKAKKYSDSDAYANTLLDKHQILAIMSRHQEALDTFNEFDKRLESDYNLWDWHKGTILYNLGKYSESVEVLESTLVEIQEKERSPTQKKFVTGLAMFSLGMAYEKLGDFDLADQAYARASQDIVIRNLDCVKVRTLIGFGGYVEAMQILNNMDSEIICIHPDGDDSVESLKSFVQERINKYVSPPSILKSSEIKCGKGTIENEYGQCVPSSQSSGGGCLIATATFGSELSPQVQMLREIRDNSLMQTQSGQSFMQGFNHFYYSFSPTIADYERHNPIFKEAVKLTITPLLASLSLLNYIDFDSEKSVLGYGIGIILINVGMYFVAPAIVISKIRKNLKILNSLFRLENLWL